MDSPDRPDVTQEIATAPAPAPPAVASSAPLRARRRFLLGLLVGAVVTAGAGLLASTFIKSPQQVVAEAAPPPPSVITAAVEQRTLDQSVVLRGTAGADRAVDVKPVLGEGRSVITRRVLKAGEAVESGTVLAEISGRPVIGLKGGIPPYREITPGMKGPDVAQLQSALRGLGYRITDKKGEFRASTQSAVRKMYTARDYEPPVRPAPVTEQPPAPKPPATGTTTPKIEYEVYVPMSELVYIRSLPAQVTAVKQALGAEVTGPILTLSLGGLVVRGTLAPTDRELVDTGMPVEIYLETTDEKIPGKVGTIGALRQAGAGDSDTAESGHPIEIRGDKAIPKEFAGQDVRLTITAATTGKPVLVVPVSAIYSVADGSTQVLRLADGNRREPVTVRTGASSGGYVQITADGLTEGDRVVIGQPTATGGQAAPRPADGAGG